MTTTADYPSLRYSVDTAITLKDTTETYIELVVPSLQHMETECLFDFLRSFLSEPELNKVHLNFILRLTRHHTAISLVLRILKDGLESTGEFSDSASYLFQNLNVASCLKYDGKVYNELLDLLFDAGLQQNYCYTKSSNKVYQVLDFILKPCQKWQ